LLISISALSIASSGPPEPDDVWQLSVLGACRLTSLSRRECAPAVVCSFECEPQGVFEGDVKGGPLVLSASFRVLLVRYPHAPAKVDTHVVWLVVACFPVFD